MDTSNLSKRRRQWYVQLKVPASLVDIVGCRSLTRSLKTPDVDEAVRKKHAVLAEFHRILDAARVVIKTEGITSGHPVDKLAAQARLLLKQVHEGGNCW